MTRFQWTAARIAEVRRAANAGESSTDLCARLGCTRGSLLGTAARHGIKFRSADSNAARKGTGLNSRAKRERRQGREIRTLLDRFAEMLAEGATIAAAGRTVYGYEGGGKVAFLKLCHRLGPQAA